jgi:hypothetical protein
LNQGDGTVQRIDPLSGAVIATIETGHPGRGGDIAAGDGYVWASLRDVPLVQIDPKANTVAALLKGTGWGDAVRFGGGSLWISGRSIRRLTPPIHKSFCELRGRQGPARGPAPVDSQSRWADAAATPDVSSLGKCSASPSDRSAHSCGANGLPRRHSGRLVCDVDRRLLLGLRCGIRCMGEGGVEALGDGLVVSPVCAIAPKPQAAPNYMI